MKLRWHTKFHQTTAAEVRELANKTGLSFREAKRALQKTEGPTLQYRTWYGKWEDVPEFYEVI